ncbi:MAG: MMPL family transporter [Thermoleophilia bacterium]|nr:MMPL family transporter [Thermoleophilia bacterium]
MSLRAFFGSAAAAIARHPWPVLAVGVALAVAAIAGAAGMGVQPVTDAFFDRDSEAYVETRKADRVFGGDPVVILARGDLAETLTAGNLDRLAVLETCVFGDIKRGRGELFDICERIAELDPVAVGAGPATFLGRAAAGINRVYEQQLKRLEDLPEGAESTVERQQLLEVIAGVASRYGLTSPPSLEDPNFVRKVVFGSGDNPKPKLSYLFPNSESAQIVLRLRSDLTDTERSEAIGLIGEATRDPSTQLEKVDYLFSGSPVVFDGLSEAFQTGILVLALVALALMSIALAAVFGSTWRLLPLALALAGVAIAAGLLRLAGGSISLAAMGAAPILIGLTVDYAVQMQARFDEADPAPGPAEAARIAAAQGVPMIATACLATASGFAALLLSPFPLVSEFGLLLGAGVLVCLLTVFLFGFAAFSLRGAGLGAEVPVARFGIFRVVRNGAKSILGLAILAPGRLLLISILVAACGWAVSTQTRAGTDISQLLPTRSGLVQDLLEVERATGTSGEVDLIVRAPDVTDPKVVRWMDRVRRDALARAGYDESDPDCLAADLCPGPAISDFVADGGAGMDAATIRGTLRGLPLREREAMIGGGLAGNDPPTVTKIPFAIRTGSVDRQEEVIDGIRAAAAESGGAAGVPDGVTAELTGLPVIVTASVDDLASSRHMLTLAGIAAVALVLLLIYRSPRRVAVPLVPILVAGGWSALIAAVLDLSLNPLSAVLAVLVTAIATEFSVILAARYYQERERGSETAAALRLTYGRTGMAIGASGITAIAGFAALIASDIGMLRDFGLIAVLDLAVALLGVAIVLPAVLAWLERR